MFLVTDGANPVAVSVSEDNGHSTSGNDVAASSVTSGNGGSDTLNLLSSNNSEEPLPPELQPTSIQVRVHTHHNPLGGSYNLSL